MLTPRKYPSAPSPRRLSAGIILAQVDEFLDVLTEDYSALYSENAVLKSKMKVLVEKVEEYRSTEEAMRKALLTAQKMADELVAQAEAKKAELLKNAETEAKARIAELQQDIRSEQMRLTAAQNATAAYVGKLKELYQHEMDYLNGLSKLSAPAEPVVDQVASAAQDISQSVEKLVAGEAPEEDAEDTVDLGGGAKEKDGGLYAELLELSRSHSPEEAEEPPSPPAASILTTSSSARTMKSSKPP